MNQTTTAKDFYSKESIKNRMFKRAAALWEIRNVDHLDPVIKLMIEALASEIFQLSGEVNNIENRILDKVARALIPGALLSARPAHAVIHARPVYGNHVISPEQEFHYKNAQFMKQYNLKRLSLSPIYPFKVVNGDVSYMISSGGCYAVDSKTGKDLMARCTNSDAITNHALWLGLELSAEVISLDQVSFYFDLPYVDHKEDYFRLLPLIQWQIGEQNLQAETGIYKAMDKKESYASEILEKYNANVQLNENIMQIYNHRFVHLKNNGALDEWQKDLFPAELKHLFTEEALSTFTKPMVWLKLTFPVGFDHNLINDLVVHMNVIPVANKFVHKTKRKVDEMMGVIPLTKESNEYFLGVDAVTDIQGNTYYEQKHALLHSDTQKNIYSLRRGGIERFDSANAKEYLDRLIDLLRNESMAFSNVEKDTLSENAVDLLKQLNYLEEKTRANSHNVETNSYIIINDKIHESTTFFASYWLSNGIIGNGIKAGELLGVSENSDIERTSTILLSTTRGGKEAPASSELQEMYRLALTSHGSIYSKHDVHSFCTIICGALMQDIEIKQGYAIGQSAEEGIIRTIDVCLKPAQGVNKQQLSEIKEDLLFGLKANSPEDFYYRILIQ